MSSLFKVQLQGEGFSVELESKVRRVGFFTVRWVTAQDAVEAEKQAAAIVKGEEKFHALVGPGVLKAVEVERCDATSAREPTGYAFYLEGEDDSC